MLVGVAAPRHRAQTQARDASVRCVPGTAAACGHGSEPVGPRGSRLAATRHGRGERWAGVGATSGAARPAWPPAGVPDAVRTLGPAPAVSRAPAPHPPAAGGDPVLDFLKAVVLGLIQGLTEFLPISSSAHLRIFRRPLRLGRPRRRLHRGHPDRHRGRRARSTSGTTSGGSRQRGSGLALQARAARTTRTRGWAGYVIVGSLPIVRAGYSCRTSSSATSATSRSSATTLIVFGLVLGFADRLGAQGPHASRPLTCAARPRSSASRRPLALIPGVSRSGATISAGLFLGYDACGRHPVRVPPGHPGGDRAPGSSSSGRSRAVTTPTASGPDRRGHRGLVRRRLRRDRLAAALRLDPLLPAVRGLPPRAGRHRRSSCCGTGVLGSPRRPASPACSRLTASRTRLNSR